MNKIKYFVSSFFKSFDEKKCPYCQSNNVIQIDQKFIFTKLLKCKKCNFQFRFPLDSYDESIKFYQDDYEQEGLTTDLPTDDELSYLIKSDFKNGAKDFSSHINLINRLDIHSERLRILDYGANWGYTSWQFIKAGFDVSSFEISKPRAKYGKEKLGIDIKTDISEIKGKFDVLFSSHVIEHLPNINDFIDVSKKLLKDNGVFIAYCPNGSDELKKTNPKGFHGFWGQVHPNYLSKDFYKFIFKKNPYLITSTPLDNDLLDKWNNNQIIGTLSNNELLIITKINKEISSENY
ncbi:class I SAM-dependent methyltransferase [Chondrinema litorale]|uniref:class I SAM-dependent methyltransferase n=1 Tax=Chondrinema litorale TaxID=2994555 RepID=UPI0025427215|nr:methyltransferase domain-containing protein [Chondrinema litorale]UZR95498.1 methyltransferase domain-containing protein [Chondrinema litorale]